MGCKGGATFLLSKTYSDWWQAPSYDWQYFAHISAGTFFQLDGAPPHFSHHVCAFLDRECPDHWIRRGGPIPWPPSFSRSYTLSSFLLGVCKRHYVIEERCKMWMSWVKELLHVHNVLPMKCLPIPDKESIIALKCVVPLMVPRLRSTE
jgi:hypothetical protein